MLITTVVNETLSKFAGSNKHVLYYLYDPLSLDRLRAVHVIESFTKQLLDVLAMPPADIMDQITRFFETRRPDMRELSEGILVPSARIASSPLFIVDGFDELEITERQELLYVFQGTTRWGCVHSHVESPGSQSDSGHC